MKDEIEKCNCKSEFPIVLQHQLTEHVLVCSNCNMNRTLNISDDLDKEITDWNQNYKKNYKKWLESENVIEELTNPLSYLNNAGLQITAKLNTLIPTYYWLHIDEGTSSADCPKCAKKLIIVENKYTCNHKVCNTCKILINE